MVSLRYSIRIADMLSINRRWIYLLTMLILISGNKFIFARFDIFTTMFVIMSIYYYLRTDYRKAFILMGIAAMIKIYP